MVAAFSSIRLTLYLHATRTEISMINADENIEQFERKRFTDLESLFMLKAMKDRMKDIKSLDASSALDVCRLHAKHA